MTCNYKLVKLLLKVNYWAFRTLSSRTTSVLFLKSPFIRFNQNFVHSFTKIMQTAEFEIWQNKCIYGGGEQKAKKRTSSCISAGDSADGKDYFT